jgi:hypothetical protein
MTLGWSHIRVSSLHMRPHPESINQIYTRNASKDNHLARQLPPPHEKLLPPKGFLMSEDLTRGRDGSNAKLNLNQILFRRAERLRLKHPLVAHPSLMPGNSYRDTLLKQLMEYLARQTRPTIDNLAPATSTIGILYWHL